MEARASHDGRTTGSPPSTPVTQGYDISLIKLSRASTKTPVKVAGSGEASIWTPGTLERIVGWGRTRENGDTPDILQKAQVPRHHVPVLQRRLRRRHRRADDALCAGFPGGGVDTCQGDSGGPMFGTTSTGVPRVVGATSFGTGCARAGIPGVYARVGDSVLREWIRSHAPGGVA